MAKKILNGYTTWIMVGMAVVLFILAPVIWAVRQEGVVKKNADDIAVFKEDVKEIKRDIKLILQKL